MMVRYYNFFGVPGRVVFDDDETPDSCEVYKKKLKGLEADNTVMLDMLTQHQSQEISHAEFCELLNRLQNESS